MVLFLKLYVEIILNRYIRGIIGRSDCSFCPYWQKWIPSSVSDLDLEYGRN